MAISTQLIGKLGGVQWKTFPAGTSSYLVPQGYTALVERRFSTGVLEHVGASPGTYVHSSSSVSLVRYVEIPLR